MFRYMKEGEMQILLGNATTSEGGSSSNTMMRKRMKKPQLSEVLANIKEAAKKRRASKL